MADPGSPLPRPSALGDLLAARRLGPDPPAAELSERSLDAVWQVAAWHAGDVALLRAIVAERLGLALPEAADAAATGDLIAFQIAPRRWWLVAQARGDALDAALASALAGRAAVTDLGHARTLLRLAGPASRSVLAKLCRIDLHPQAFPPGRTAQTALGQVAVLIHVLDERPGFDLYLPRSLARSAASSLIDAATEFGLALSDAAD